MKWQNFYGAGLKKQTNSLISNYIRSSILTMIHKIVFIKTKKTYKKDKNRTVFVRKILEQKFGPIKTYWIQTLCTI